MGISHQRSSTDPFKKQVEDEKEQEDESSSSTKAVVVICANIFSNESSLNRHDGGAGYNNADWDQDMTRILFGPRKLRKSGYQHRQRSISQLGFRD